MIDEIFDCFVCVVLTAYIVAISLFIYIKYKDNSAYRTSPRTIQICTRMEADGRISERKYY